MAAGDSPSSEYPETPPAHWPARLPPPPATPPPPTRGGAALIIAAAVAFTLVVTYGLGQALVRADDPGGRVAAGDGRHHHDLGAGGRARCRSRRPRQR